MKTVWVVLLLCAVLGLAGAEKAPATRPAYALKES